LRGKDDLSEDVSERAQEYEWVKQNKNAYLVQQEEVARYNKQLMGKCIKPCLVNLQTSVVTTEESECMTNCMGKGLQVQAMFRLWNADQDMKRFGGFRK